MKAPEAESGKKTAIVGSGPAGLTAAYYLRRLGHQVLVYDKMEEAGGLLRYAIPEYRLPKDIVKKLISALEAMGIQFKTGTEIGRDIPVSDLVEQFDSVFLNTGAWKRPLIGLDGEMCIRDRHLVDGPGIFRVGEKAVNAQLMEKTGGLSIVQKSGHFDGVHGLGEGGDHLGAAVASADSHVVLPSGGV